MKKFVSIAVSFCLLVTFILPIAVIAEPDISSSVAALKDESIESSNDSQDDYSYVDYAAHIDSET